MPKPSALLITRPEPQASRLAAALRAEWGDRLEISLSPLMETEYLTPILPEGPVETLILTSEAGVEAAGRLLGRGIRLPSACACVGSRTAEAVKALGLGVIGEFATASALLAGQLSRPAGPYLYLHGRDVTLPLDEMLTKAGQTARAAIVYAQHEMPLGAEALALLRRQPVAVPLYSARSARLFLKAAPEEALAFVHPVAFSAAVTLALPADLATRAITAETPDGPGMLAAIRRAILGQLP
jgi:uroporphyrinogen-III synthase